MSPGAPTTMLHFLISQPVLEDGQFCYPELVVQTGDPVVQLVSWSERHGDTETFFSESWKPKAPNIWLATSRKK